MLIVFCGVAIKIDTNQSWYSHVQLITKKAETRLKWSIQNYKRVFFYHQNYIAGSNIVVTTAIKTARVTWQSAVQFLVCVVQ